MPRIRINKEKTWERFEATECGYILVVVAVVQSLIHVWLFATPRTASCHYVPIWRNWSQRRPDSSGHRQEMDQGIVWWPWSFASPTLTLDAYYQIIKKKKKKGAKRKLRHNNWALLENSQHETLIVIKTGRLCSLWKLFSREDPKGVTFPTVILSRFQFPTVFPTHLINLKLTPRNPVSQPLHPIITWPSQWKILHILQENEY